MLGTRDAVAHIAVRDLDSARRFYEDTVGLRQVHREGEEAIIFASGNSSVNVYRSQYAGTNKATALGWAVDDVEQEVQALKARGVAFEHYDLPGLERKGDIHGGDQMRIAWFKDPDGNILSIYGN